MSEQRTRLITRRTLKRHLWVHSRKIRNYLADVRKSYNSNDARGYISLARKEFGYLRGLVDLLAHGNKEGVSPVVAEMEEAIRVEEQQVSERLRFRERYAWQSKFAYAEAAG